jgi:hypothetical protein
MSTYGPSSQGAAATTIQGEKLRLPTTEFFYRRAMERSAEIRAQIEEAKAGSEDQNKGEADK